MFDFAELFSFCDLHASRCALDGWFYHRPMYYDRQGFPIPSRDGKSPTLVWADMSADRDYKIVRQDLLPDGTMLSTVWLGLDHAWAGPPRIFETMRFSNEGDGAVLEFPDPREDGTETEQLRYCTEEEALAHHDRIVILLKRRLLH
jgi:hypothetical protein